jgi:RpiR family carbohydrate utilization transcriptional regulator
MLIITQNLASPYLNTADFILQCGTTNRNDVGKYAALMANDLILMGYLRAYDKAFQ